MLRAVARRVRNAALSADLYAPPGHYYSPSTSSADRDRQSGWDREAAEDLPGIDLDLTGHEELSRTLAGFAGSRKPRRWSATGNAMFDLVDASVLHCMLAWSRPSRIVEIGSGYSTAVMLDAADAIGSTRDITCVEPYPQRLRSLLLPDDDLRIVESPVQDVDLSVFTELGPGDLLFVDSTHVAKSGSDVLFLYLEVFPRLRAGVRVHVHDIFWPFSYRSDWVTEGRDWTEAYLLRALLTDSPRWRITWFSDFVWSRHPELGQAIVPGTRDARPGSIYLERR